MSILPVRSDLKLFKVAYFSFYAVLIALSVFFISTENLKLFVVCLGIPVLIISAFYFDKYFMYFFVGSLFLVYGFPMRLQFVNLISFVIILFFILNKDKSDFAQFNLPKTVKFAGGFLVFAVLLSSFRTPHFSYLSVYYGIGFVIYIVISYITFRYNNDTSRVSNMLNAFFYGTFFAGIIILFFVFSTGNIRFASVSGYAYFDFTCVALLIAVFSYFILGSSNNIIKIATLVIFITLITSLSRNSWIGFTVSFVYGIIITARFQKNVLHFFKNKIAVIFILIFVAIFLLTFTSLGNIVFQRLTQSNFQIFSSPNDGEFITNSLESRVLIWIVALNAFLHNPLTGVGYFMFYNVSENYNVLPELLYDTMVKGLDAHTTYLNFLCETGIIGLSAFIIYLVTILRVSYKAIKVSKNEEEFKISIILHVIVFFIFVHSIYSGAFTFGQNAFQMHFFLGLAVANYINLYKNQKLNTGMYEK